MGQTWDDRVAPFIGKKDRRDAAKAYVDKQAKNPAHDAQTCAKWLWLQQHLDEQITAQEKIEAEAAAKKAEADAAKKAKYDAKKAEPKAKKPKKQKTAEG